MNKVCNRSCEHYIVENYKHRGNRRIEFCDKTLKRFWTANDRPEDCPDSTNKGVEDEQV